MSYRILRDPSISIEENVRLAREALKQREEREARQQAALEADREKRKAIAEALEQRKQEAVERRATKEKADKQREAERLKIHLRAVFFNENPSATEEDFNRLWPSLRDEHFKRSTLQHTLDPFEAAKVSLKKKGGYSL
jgi:glutathione synthase/RimK-type ligase-like ATP-grasp enzyme